MDFPFIVVVVLLMVPSQNWFISRSLYARLRNLKVYKNELSDNGALALASLIAQQCSPLEELHLSHNNITSVGAAALFKAFAEARAPSGQFVYPRFDSIRGAQLPVWIRLEYNKILDTHAVLSKWDSESRALRKLEGGCRLTCFADRLAS